MSRISLPHLMILPLLLRRVGYGKSLKTCLSTCLLIICERVTENRALPHTKTFQKFGQSCVVSDDRCINANVCGVDTESIREVSRLILPLRVGVARTEGACRQY